MLRYLCIACVALWFADLRVSEALEESDSRFSVEFRPLVAGGPCSTDAIGKTGERGPILEVAQGERFEIAVIVEVKRNQDDDVITQWQFSLCHDIDLVEPVDPGELSCSPENQQGFWRTGTFFESLQNASSVNVVAWWHSDDNGEGLSQAVIVDVIGRPDFGISDDRNVESIVFTYLAKEAGKAIFRFDGDEVFPCNPLGGEIFKIESALVASRRVGGIPEVVFYKPRENGLGEVRIRERVLFARGDTNGDSRLTISDVVTLVLQLAGIKPVSCPDASDVGDNGSIELADAVLLMQYQFARGAPPADPFPGCGPDPKPDGLACEGQAGCR